MAVSFVRSFALLAMMSISCSVTTAGLIAAPYLAAPVTVPVAAAYTIPSQGVLRTAYNQVVGRSYAPSFVPVASSLAYAAAPVVAPVVKAVPTVFAAPPQLVAGPVLKTVRPVETPLTYAAPAVAAFAPAVRAVAAPAPVFTPPVLSTRLAPLPAVGVALGLTPALASAPAASLPGVFDARSAAPAPSATPGSTVQRAFVTAFGSPAGIQLVGVGSAFEGASTNVEIARAAPGGQGDGAQQERSASPAAPASGTPENFGVQQQTPFSEYGLPVPAGTPVNP
ncbi:calphotin-like [Anopheles marshallii]|uniref:calphotin-like n=1 Tax=Anopheles marshallii TaxID=1521116 RepID=UPI00237B74DC|nr:calphotin-like [Anopheles marshallii]